MGRPEPLRWMLLAGSAACAGASAKAREPTQSNVNATRIAPRESDGRFRIGRDPTLNLHVALQTIDKLRLSVFGDSGRLGWTRRQWNCYRAHMPSSSRKKPLVIVTRKLPEAIETRLMELFETRLNVDDS